MLGEAKWERFGAATGILFVVLLVVSVFMVPTPPDVNASAQTISTYYSDHRTAVMLSMYVGGLAAVAFLWFLGSLYQTLRRAEGEHARLSIVCLGGGICIAAVALASAAFNTSLAYSSALHGDDGAVRGLYLLSVFSIQFVYFAIATFVAAGSILMIRTGVISRWIGEAGVVFAMLMLVGAGSFASGGALLPQGGIEFGGLAAFAVWMLATSVRMVMLASPKRAAMDAAPIAH